MVCKTIIRRFKSARRLHTLLAATAAAAIACSDPPEPPRAAPSSPSHARHVQWRDTADAVTSPIARVVDRPGGRLDAIVADPDVTTFLNDRFHPVFEVGQPASVTFTDACGEPLLPPASPEDAAAFIALANVVVQRPAAPGCPR